MKQKILLVLLCGIMFLNITGCYKNINKEKYVNLIKDYIKKYEILNEKSYPAEYSKFDSKLYSTSARGNISNVLYDLDDDDDYEGLVFNFGDEAIDVTLLDIENEKIKELDSQTLLNFLPEIDKFDINVFAIKFNNKPYFFLEINGSSSLLADGMYFELRRLNVKDNKLIVSSPINYQASFIDEAEASDYINKVKRMGLSMETMDKSIFSQNDKAIKIFEITRKHLEDFDASKVSKFEYSIQYGNTKFKDYLYEKYIIELENVKTKINTENMEYEYKTSNLGHYTYENDNNIIEFELNKKDDKYSYTLSYYPNNSTHASEELWGSWDVTKTEFTMNNENTTNLAEYKIKNVKYLERQISFEIELTKLKSEQYKDYVIPNGTYNLIK